MPTYDYQCQSCGHNFSALHKISDAAPACPQCGGEARKKLSAPAVHGAAAAASTPAPEFAGCGGSCACHHRPH